MSKKPIDIVLEKKRKSKDAEYYEANEKNQAETLKQKRKTKRLDFIKYALTWNLCILSGLILIKTILISFNIDNGNYFFTISIVVVYGLTTTLIGVLAGSSID